MKKSDLIASLQNEIEEFGDEYIMSFQITGEAETTSRYMLSQTRKGPMGQKVKMTVKEFHQWVKEQKAKEQAR